MAEIDYIGTWESLGFEFKRHEKECITYNPFDGGDKKMYVNAETGLWIAYGVSSLSGNMYTFIEMYYEHCLKNTGISNLTPLADEKKLPVQAFSGQVAYNKLNNTYLIAFREFDGKIRGMQSYVIGGKCKNVKGLQTGLWGAEKLKDNKTSPVWVCEGIWDALAMQWLCKSTEEDALITAIQGGNPFGFKEAFVPFLNRRTVYIWYDNDRAGFDGEEKVFSLLHRVAEQLLFVSWPEILREKYDVRDFLVENGGFPGYPKLALKKVVDTLKGLLNRQTKYQRTRDLNKEHIPEGDLAVPQRQEVEDLFNKWLKMTDSDALAIMFGTIFANRISTRDPIWMFMVTPPAGMKTELISKLCKSPRITSVNKLTPAGLISSSVMRNGEDPSLLKASDKKTLVITDFTTLIEGNRIVRDEVFSILRDAYDGKVEKQFAKFKKVIESNFGILAAVTPIIDSSSSINSALGERFLRYRIEKDLTPFDEEARMIKAIGNIGDEGQMGDELFDICYRYLEKKMPDVPPKLNKDRLIELISTAKFTAMLRAHLIEDALFGETQVMPFSEFGTRLAKQFVKLAMGLSIYFDQYDEISGEALRLTKEVALDTCPQITLEMVRSVYILNKENGKCTCNDVSEKLGLSNTTITRRAGRLTQLNIFKRINDGFGKKQYYQLSETVENLVEKAVLFK